MDTPTLFPVVSPFSNLISPREMNEKYGVQAIFTNAYIIYKNIKKNPDILKNKLHKHLDFPGLIATDSGAFQNYMYGGDFKIEPEEIEPFEEALGSDFPVILDTPIQTTDSYEIAKSKIITTIKRAKNNIERRKRTDTAWFGPIHGSIYPDLLKLSSIEMSKLEFGIYAIGGVVKTFIDYRFDLDIAILRQVKRYLRPDRPIHMFGLGLPSFFSLAVAAGADTFDSAAYYLYAKDDRYFTLHGTKKLEDLYEFPCNCPVCTSYTPQELRALSKPERIKALSSHNLYISMSEIRTIRQAIREGTLWDLVEMRVQAHPKLRQAFRLFKDRPEEWLSYINLNKSRGLRIHSQMIYYHPKVVWARSQLHNFKVPIYKKKWIIIPELDLPSISHPQVRDWINQLNMKKKGNNNDFNEKSKLYEQNKQFEQNRQPKQYNQENKNNDKNVNQIFIASNLFGLIPIQLAEIFPFAQNEGNLDIRECPNEIPFLISIVEHFIKNTIPDENNEIVIKVFTPKSFKDQFGIERVFNEKTHFLNKFKSYITNTYIYTNISNLKNQNEVKKIVLKNYKIFEDLKEDVDSGR